jgi:hypothetical protein
MDRLSETDLADFVAEDSLSITTGNDTGTSRTFWSEYLSDPTTLEFLSREEKGDTGEANASRTLEGFLQKLPEFTATVTAAGANDTLNAGMSRIQFSSGLTRFSEGPTTTGVWLGGLPHQKNAGKIFDFYSDQLRSYTLPNSSLNISTY